MSDSIIKQTASELTIEYPKPDDTFYRRLEDGTIQTLYDGTWTDMNWQQLDGVFHRDYSTYGLVGWLRMNPGLIKLVDNYYGRGKRTLTVRIESYQEEEA